ncbi:hypothetical protein [Trichothermofontia sp.]
MTYEVDTPIVNASCDRLVRVVSPPENRTASAPKSRDGFISAGATLELQGVPMQGSGKRYR